MKKSILNLFVFSVIICVSSFAQAVRVTRFNFSNTHVSFKKYKWAVSMEICNKDKNRHAGTFDLQFQLHANGRHWNIGHRTANSPEVVGDCMTYTDYDIPVNLRGLPLHTRYAIYLDIAERNDNKWLTVDSVKMNKDWIVN